MILTTETEMSLIMIGIIIFMIVSCGLIIYFGKKKEKRQRLNNSPDKYHNDIKNMDLKINIANAAITLLINANKMTVEDIDNVQAEYAYLLSSQDNTIALLKIVTNNQAYYFSMNDGSTLTALDNTKFGDELFYITQKQMFELHNVHNYNKSDYIMTVGEK